MRRPCEAYAGGRIPHRDPDGHLHRVRTALTRGAPGSVPAPLPAETPGTASAIAVAAAHGGCPGPLRVESAFGKPRLSLSRAIMEHPPAGIEPQLRTGGAGIRVPRDAMVEPQGLVTG